MYLSVGYRKNLQRILKKQGLEFKMNTKVTGATPLSSGGVQVAMEAVKGSKKESVECDVLLVSVGRKPYTSGLGVEVCVCVCVQMTKL